MFDLFEYMKNFTYFCIKIIFTRLDYGRQTKDDCNICPRIFAV